MFASQQRIGIALVIAALLLAGCAGTASNVRAVIAMGKSLGCRVIAEGVETRDQCAYLREENCDEGQGFHFSPAVPAAAFAKLLSENPFMLRSSS